MHAGTPTTPRPCGRGVVVVGDSQPRSMWDDQELLPRRVDRYDTPDDTSDRAARREVFVEQITTRLGSVPLWIVVLAAVGGFGIGRFVPDRVADAATERYASPVAETTAVCVAPTATPEPSPTPTATTVPPVGMNNAIPYGESWSIAVKDATNAARINRATASGIFIRLTLSITNTGTANQSIATLDFVIRDGAGRLFERSGAGTVNANGAETFRRPPGGPTDLVIVFDVPVDATGPFILESKSDPAFRVQIELSQRG